VAADPTVLICVGATKSGTSWLYRHLRAHPECHFRSIKELHYFDMNRPQHFVAAEARIAAQVGFAEAELRAAPEGARFAAARKLADLRDWRAVLAKGELDLDAYRSFLQGGADGARVVGDVTPAYAMLPVNRLKRLARVAPDVRVLFLMRDPVARTWSHIRMVAARTGAAFETTARALLARMVAGDLSGEGQGIHDRGDYRGIIPRLKAAFAPAALHLDFCEAMLAEGGLAPLWSFLGIGPAPVARETKVYESPKLALSEGEARALRHWLQPQYDYVSGLFPTLPTAWRMNRKEGLA
jgi:hypothetical protein